jgi:hypothetical protein
MAEAVAFSVREPTTPAVQVRVNFGVFAGRNATQAEIDDLARVVQNEVEFFSVVAEERHEFGASREAAVRQIVVEVNAEHAGDDIDALCDRLVAHAERWAAGCIQSRSELGELGSEL